MKKDDGIRTCRKCGRQISIIKWGFYHTAVVDAFPVMVRADAGGEDYVRADGSKVKAVELPYDSTDEQGEPAFRMHRKSCEVTG